jgi:hypothetical protein
MAACVYRFVITMRKLPFCLRIIAPLVPLLAGSLPCKWMLVASYTIQSDPNFGKLKI